MLYSLCWLITASLCLMPNTRLIMRSIRFILSSVLNLLQATLEWKVQGFGFGLLRQLTAQVPEFSFQVVWLFCISDLRCSSSSVKMSSSSLVVGWRSFMPYRAFKVDLWTFYCPRSHMISSKLSQLSYAEGNGSIFCWFTLTNSTSFVISTYFFISAYFGSSISTFFGFTDLVISFLLSQLRKSLFFTILFLGYSFTTSKTVSAGNICTG